MKAEQLEKIIDKQEELIKLLDDYNFSTMVSKPVFANEWKKRKQLYDELAALKEQKSEIRGEEKYYPHSFVLWLDFGDHDFYLNAEKDQAGYYQEGSHTINTLEEVFEFWKKNVVNA